MRLLLLIPFMLVSVLLVAQSKAPDYAQKANAPAMQKLYLADCYVKKFDAATSAQRRGDYRAALRLFEEAKNCPEAQSSSRRLRELANNIESCQKRLGIKAASEADAKMVRDNGRSVQTVESNGRKFTISSALARNTDANCFQMTVREADRAFRDSCWDDAAKLYRAAKNCADANQTDRERMYNRIEACTAAAEDELLQKEQKAVRTARHAIAANLADDAKALLRQGDRSLAWRLADFVNFYIAPDDNPNCLEAIYSAYYYQDPASEHKFIQPAFCYQLSQDLNGNVQFKFTESKEGAMLTAFVPQENRVISWQLPDMTVVYDQKFGFLKPPTSFDIAPDGSLLFIGDDFFYLPSGQLLELPGGVSHFCFSEDGEYFFYEDLSSGTLQANNLKTGAHTQQQTKAKGNIGRNYVPPVSVKVPTGLLDLHFYKNEFWLGYPDRIEVIKVDRQTGAMQTRMTWNLADTFLLNAGELGMYIFPQTREAVVSLGKETYYYFLHLSPTDSNQVALSAVSKVKGTLNTCTATEQRVLTVTNATEGNNWDEIISITSPAEDSIACRMINKVALQSEGSVAISPDGAWLAVQNANGQTLLWSLRDGKTAPVSFEDPSMSTLSPNGIRVYNSYKNELRILDADDLSGNAQQTLSIWPDVPLPEGASNQWAVYASSESAITIHQLDTKQERRFDVKAIVTPVPFAFDAQESRFFAYSPGNGEVLVKSLTDGSTLGSRSFGGEITLIRSIPGTDQLVVVIRTSIFNGYQYTVKVWDFLNRSTPIGVVRLQGYSVMNAIVSDQGDRLALSDGRDIRVFLLGNLDDEFAVIKNRNAGAIGDIAFRPDGLALASGDFTGEVVIWDAKSGQALLRFNNIWNNQSYPVFRIAFAYGGSRLRLYSPGKLFTVNLDALSLRDDVQSGNRWLQSFTPDQIQAYKLETAFRYPGNFDRLAQSGDVPLIRSFFDFFRDRSISSNNIEQVRTYCDRAFTLYELLDEGGQKNLEPTMLSMYKDYILKQLLRNNPTEAAKVVAHLEKRFARPNDAILSAAYTSLVQHDLKAASRLFSDYLMRLPYDAYFNSRLDKINTELSQFQEYELLDSAQTTCLCEVFQPFHSFENLCPPTNKYTPSPYSAQLLAYRSIFEDIESVAYYNYHARIVETLEQALAKAKTLEYPNPVVEKHPFEAVVIALAGAYIGQAKFEQSSPKVPKILEKAVALLDKSGPFKSGSDTARLERLTQVHLLWGQYLAAKDKTTEAIAEYNNGLAAAKKLAALTKDDKLNEIRVGLENIGPLYAAIGEARLLEGKPVEAREAFDQAKTYLGDRMNSVGLANAAVLENDTYEAFINYGGLSSAQELGETLSLLDRMAALLPAQSSNIKTFVPRLREAFLGNHPAITAAEINYWEATYQMSYFSGQNRWDSALVWSSQAMKNMSAIRSNETDAELWAESWHSLRITHVFYMLNAWHNDSSALSAIIRYSKETLAWIEDKRPYSELKSYVYTNMAHAYWLRNQPGDRDRAVELYRTHLEQSSVDRNVWEMLLKDFIDLHQSGVQWPDLKNLIRQIKPDDIEISAESWQEMGG